MQFRLIVAMVIFVGSYLPLSLILLAQNYDYSAVSRSFCAIWSAAECEIPLKNPVFAGASVLVCAACFMVTLITLRVLKPKQPVLIRAAKHVPTDLMNYTLPYVVSFMNLDYQDMPKFAGLVIFLAWMFWITHKAGQILLNPLLIVFGWRFYDVTYSFPGKDNEHAANALVFGRITPGERHPHAAVQDLLIIKNTSHPES